MVPNDVTSDVYAMRYRHQTALANAVLDAMVQTKIPTGDGAPPVMVTGFSLGGITAGPIAATSSDYNIQQVVTAGSPIGTMPISPKIHVVALEGSQDLVPTLVGAINSKAWTTVHHTGYPLVGESNPIMNNDPNIARFLGGPLTVTDYASVRK